MSNTDLPGDEPRDQGDEHAHGADEHAHGAEDHAHAADEQGPSTSPTAPMSPSSPPPPPAAGARSSESRNWAMGAHLSAFIGAWVALAFVGPLVIYLVRKDQDPFAEHHAKEALNFNLTVLVVMVVGVIAGLVLSLVTFGLALLVFIPLGAAIGIGWLVLTIIAAIRASNGEGYRYPFTIRFV